MTWNHFLNGLATRPYEMMGFAIVGGVLVVFSLRRLIKSSRIRWQKLKHVWSVLFLVVGASIGGLSLFVIVSRPNTLGQLFRRDFSDARTMEKLKKLELNSKTVALPGAWPQWRGPRRDGVSDETGLLDAWPEQGPPVVWKQPIHGGYSAISVVDGRAYTMDRVGNQERVLCFDAETGQPLWEYPYDIDYRHIAYPSGPRATPTVYEGRIYTVGATGTFLCLKEERLGEPPHVLWQRDLLSEFDANLPQWGVASSPLIEENLVIVQAGGVKGSIAAFDRMTGEVVWAVLDDLSGYSSPVAATCAGVRQIIAFTGRGVVGLRSTNGEQLWYYPWSTQFNANIATPIVTGDHVFISSDYGAGCALLELLPKGANEVQVKPVYNLVNKLMRNHHSSSVLKDGYVYGFDKDFLKCVDLRTAEEKWQAGRDVKKGSLILADGKLIILTQEGTLVLAKATPEAFSKEGQLPLFHSSEVWALPSLANGRLYVRDRESMICLDLRASNQDERKAPAQDASPSPKHSGE